MTADDASIVGADGTPAPAPAAASSAALPLVASGTEVEADRKITEGSNSGPKIFSASWRIAENRVWISAVVASSIPI